MDDELFFRDSFKGTTEEQSKAAERAELTKFPYRKLYMSLTKDNTKSIMLKLPPFNKNEEYQHAYNDMLITIGTLPKLRHPTNNTEGDIPSSMLSMLCNFNKSQYDILIDLLTKILSSNNESKYELTRLFLENSKGICEFEGKSLDDHIRSGDHIINTRDPDQTAGSKYRRKRTRKNRTGRKSRSKKYKRTRRSYTRMHANKNKNKKYSRNKK